jgi:hypothetical protein
VQALGPVQGVDVNDANDRLYVEACEEVDRIATAVAPITPRDSRWNAEGRARQAKLDAWHMTSAYQDAKLLCQAHGIPVALLDRRGAMPQLKAFLASHGVDL